MAQPAAEQRFSLPVWIPGSYLVREFARHCRRSRPSRAARRCRVEQLDKATWRVRCERRGAARRELPRLRLRHLGARGLPRCARAASSTAPACACASKGAKPSRTRSTLVGLPARLAGRDRRSMPRSRRAARHAIVAADYDELVDHPVELGRFWRGSFEAAGVPHEFVVAGAWPDFDGERLLADAQRICETADPLLARRRGKRAVRALPVHAQRGRRRLRRARAPREHGADRARGATCRARGANGERHASDGYVDAARPDQPRVLPHLERQAAEAARVRALRLHARELHRAALVLRGLHLVLRRPAAAARRPDRRGALPEAARARRSTRVLATPGRAGAERRRRRASTPGSSTTAATRTRRTRRSATTPRARWSRSRST